MFTIIQDTREQTPFKFSPGIPVELSKLDTGDYSMKNLTDLVTIERKSVQDLVGCIGKGRERFERELKRMRGYRYRAVVIEGTLQKLSGGNWRGKILPQHVLGSIASWRIKYGIDFIYAGNADLAAQETERLLRKFHDYCSDYARRFR